MHLSALAHMHLEVARQTWLSEGRVAPKVICHGHAADVVLVGGDGEARDVAPQLVARFAWLTSAYAVGLVAESWVNSVTPEALGMTDLTGMTEAQVARAATLRADLAFPHGRLAELAAAGDRSVHTALVVTVLETLTGSGISLFLDVDAGTAPVQMTAYGHLADAIRDAMTWKPPRAAALTLPHERRAVLDHVWALARGAAADEARDEEPIPGVDPLLVPGVGLVHGVLLPPRTLETLAVEVAS